MAFSDRRLVGALLLVLGAAALMTVGSCAGGGGAAYTIALTAVPTTLGVGATTAVTATVTQSAVPQSGVVVTWGVTPAGAVTFATPTSITGAAGTATVIATGVTAGAATITGAVTGANGNVAVTITAVAGPAVTLAVAPASVAVGGASTATATVTDNSVVQAGQTVTFAITDGAVATFTGANTAVTNASGQAAVAITGAAVGNTTVTATAMGATSTAQPLAVTAPPTAERVLFYDASAVQFEYCDNVDGGTTPTNADLGGLRIVLGNENGGPLALVANAGATQAWVRDLAAGTETGFGVSSLDIAGWFNRATISGATDRVFWARNNGGGRELVAANLDGSGESVIVPAIINPNGPLCVSVSPDGSNVAWVSGSGFLRRTPAAGGASVPITLGTSVGARAVAWYDNASLIVSVTNYQGTGHPGLIRAYTNGDLPTGVYDAAGLGLRSASFGIGVDGAGNVIFDELDVGGTQYDIQRIDAPFTGARVSIVVRAANDGWPGLLDF